jgi:uncharacterized protein DUF4209
MSALSPAVIHALAEIERSTDAISESSVADRLRDAIQHSAPWTSATLEEKSELFAFLVTSGYKDETTGWGTYYGPRAIFKDAKGNSMESPSLSMVGPESVPYWMTRAEESQSPMMRIRYADLVWDLGRRLGARPPLRMAHIVIDSTLDLLHSRQFTNEITAIQRATRALHITIRIKDAARTAAVRDSIISLERDIAQDDKLGTWGFAFDNLVGNDGALLTIEQESHLVNELEARLQRVGQASDSGSGNPFAAEAAAMKLVEYYKGKGDMTNIKRVLLSFGAAFTAAAKTTSPLVGHSWLEKLHSIYMFHGLRAEADQLAVLIRERGVQAVSEMQAISTRIELPADKVDGYVLAVTSGGLDEVLHRIAVEFLPDPDKAKEDVLSFAKEAPLVSLLSQSIIDRDGRTIARIGSLESDLDGRVVAHIAEELRFNATFLRKVLGRLQAEQRLDTSSLIQHLCLSPAFRDDRKPLLERGLSAYLTGDYATSAHLLIPQIEAALRYALILVGGSEYRPGRNSALQLKTMDEVLRDGLLTDGLGFRMCHYLRTLFTDPRGWNLRNNVMHGLFQATAFGEESGDRVLHALLLLATLRAKPPS